MNEQFYDEVVSFVSEFVGLKKEMISLDTSINVDLGVGGEDGEDFVISFADKFEVDLSEFHASTYFGYEGFNPFVLFFIILDLLRLRDKPPARLLTVHDLVIAAERKKLVGEESKEISS